jgi:MSHA biogenesis protein MshQ
VYGTMSLVGDSLVMPVASLYFNASNSWTVNVDDSCTSYSYTKTDASVAATAAPVSPVTLVNGLGNLTLTLTNGGNPGGNSVVNTVWPSWLQFDFDGVDQLSDGNTYDDNASAIATFGIFRGDDRYLYWREAP